MGVQNKYLSTVEKLSNLANIKLAGRTKIWATGVMCGISTITQTGREMILVRQKGNMMKPGPSSQNWFKQQPDTKFFVLDIFKHSTIWWKTFLVINTILCVQ